MIALCLFLWWLSGFSVFIYCWYLDFDIEIEDLFVGAFFGLFGLASAVIIPMCWLIMKWIDKREYKEYKEPKVLIKKRGTK